MKRIEVKPFNSGYCTNNQKAVFPKEKSKTIEFPVLFFLLKHEEKGYILFDTGYSTRFYEETKKFPYSIYAKITPVYTEEKDSAIFQLKELGIEPNQINYIFLSHFHADHMAGLKDFPNAKIICSKEAYSNIKDKQNFSALKSAFIPNLMPKDIEEKAIFIEETNKFNIGNDKSKEITDFLNVFGQAYDIFGDGSLLSVDISGHAQGQYGLFFKTENGYCFLIADAVWKSKSYKECIFPTVFANLIMYSPKLFKENLKKINRFYKLQPSVKIVPSHCEEAYESLL